MLTLPQPHWPPCWSSNTPGQPPPQAHPLLFPLFTPVSTLLSLAGRPLLSTQFKTAIVLDRPHLLFLPYFFLHTTSCHLPYYIFQLLVYYLSLPLECKILVCVFHWSISNTCHVVSVQYLLTASIHTKYSQPIIPMN